MAVIYLDNNATTPLNPIILNKMTPYFSEFFANPSSQYSLSSSSVEAIKNARKQTAAAIGSEEDEIIFTSGGTEANNLAIQGIANAYLTNNKPPGHIISNRIEHASVLNILKNLQEQGWEISYVPANKNGIIDPESIKSAIKENTCLISIMLANNEIGVVQDLPRISAIGHAEAIPVHTDAIQAIGKIPTDINDLGVDIMSISGHKFYGPKGTGALYCKKRLILKPVLFGGGQEKNLKPGTENVPGIVGFGAAIEAAANNVSDYAKHTSTLISKLKKGITEQISDYYFNGNSKNMLPNTLNVSFEGIDAVSLQTYLSSKGIFVSTGSACNSANPEVSHVLKWIKTPPRYSFSAIRFSLGENTEEVDIDITIDVLKQAVKKLRA